MKKAMIWILIVLGGIFLFSDQVLHLSIEKAIEMALQNNTGYKISQLEVSQARKGVQKNMGFLPTVSIDGYRVLDETLMELEMPPLIPGEEPTKVSLDFTKNYEFALQIVQPIFTGGKIWFSFKNAQIDLRIAKEKLKNSKKELILNVKKIYFNIQVMKELLKTHQESLQLAENNYQNVNQSYQLGMVSKYDLLRAELSMSSAKPKILNISKLLMMMESNLKVMLGIPDETEIQISGSLDYDKRQLDLANLVESALINRSEILQLKMEEMKTSNLLKMTWAQYIPDFSLVAAYNYRSDNLNFRAGNWESFYSINLGVSFPIFTGLRRSAEIGEMRVLRKMLKLNVKELSDATRLEVKDLYLTMKEEYENILLGLKNIETAREGVRIAELNYQEGLISILELNTSISAMTQARVMYLQAIYNFNIALSTLEKITGVDLNGGEK